MAFLLNHWHCILPVAGILIGAWLMGAANPKNGTTARGTIARKRSGSISAIRTS